MKYTAFHEQRFRSSVARALNHVQTILDNTRQPRLAEEEDHTYDDKFALAEFLTNTSIASQMNALERLGLDPKKIIRIMQWVHDDDGKGQAVTLRFQAEDSCQFLMEQEVEMNTGITKEIEQTKTTSGSHAAGTSIFGGQKTETVRTKVVTKVKEYHWKVTVSYKIIVFPGVQYDKSIELQSRSTETVIVTAAGTGTSGSAQSTRIMSPLPERSVHPPVDTKLTWFFQVLSPKEQTCQFSINREAVSCKTPRRNNDIKAAESFNRHLFEWSLAVQGFFLDRVEKQICGKHNPVNKPAVSNRPGLLEPGSTGIMTGLQKEPTFNGKRVRIVEYNKETQRYKAEPVDLESGLPHTLSIKPANIQPDEWSASRQGPPLSSLTDESILCPIIPLMEKESVLDMGDVGDFLTEQSRAMDEQLDNLAKLYPARQLVKLISVAEAAIVLMSGHLESLTTQYLDSVDYIEHMLKQQLVQAIGKEINGSDFEQFMRFHNRKLFAQSYRPNPFSYAIRRPGFYPDGVLSIESKSTVSSQQTTESIETFTKKVAGTEGPSIFIPIGAATSVEITGDRYLHGWMQHRFRSKAKPEFNIACRARQFSSFMVLIGTIGGPDVFDAKDAIILQNKDEVLIPLLTNVLPSAKEFKDAIASLSPEQQEFAKAYRSMQLESSVFGVCVIQIKPQLEKLLGLPDCSLAKEIQLTQDLLSLFIDYQIPSDLLSLNGASSGDSATGIAPGEKVAAVKGYVKAVMDVIESAKEKQICEEEMKADMRAEMQNESVVPCSAASVGMEGPASVVPSFRMRKNGSKSTLPASPRGEGHAQMTTAFQMPMAVGAASSHMSMAVGAAAPQIATETIAADGASIGQRQRQLRKIPESSKSPSRDKAQVQLSELEKNQLTLQTNGNASSLGEDFTLLPKLLDAKLEKHDKDGALRSTIIKAGENWTRTRQVNLLVSPMLSTLSQQDTVTEKKKAFDLLDAISRSGTLAIQCSELHVIVAVSHCFDNDIMGSVIQDNINPVEKVDRSSLILASAVHGVSAIELIHDVEDVKRLTCSFPLLFDSTPSNVPTQRFV